MKQSNLAKLPGRGMFLAMIVGSIFSISSCKKDSISEPDTSPTPPTSYASEAAANNVSSGLASTPYKIVAPLNLYRKSNMTINGDSIVGNGVACIQLIQCTNIHITNCRLGNSKSFGILIGQSSNIQIDYNNISKVSTGILAVGCPSGAIRITHNQILNTTGPFPQGAGIQFSGVNGGNNHIDYNRVQNIVGQCNPEDKISIYKSYGKSGDPITVTGNMILGSGSSTSACGVTLGDQGGSYQTAQNNTIVNSGAGGMQIAGGTFIKIINNSVYSAPFAWSHMGVLCSNYSGMPSNNLTISGNKINWTSGNPKDQINGKKTRVMNASGSVSSATNTFNAAISAASLLPTKIVNFLLFQ